MASSNTYSPRKWTQADKERTAIAIVANGGRIATAAKKVGIPVQTVFTWRDRDPEFKALIEQAHKQWHGQCSDRIKTLVEAAYDELLLRLADPEERAKISTRELNMLTAVQLDKLQLVDKVEKFGVQQASAAGDVINKLLDEFQRVADRANAKIVSSQ